MSTEKRWLTVAQTADLLQVHIKSAYAMAARGEIPFVKIGKRTIRIDGKALERELENQISGQPPATKAKGRRGIRDGR